MMHAEMIQAFGLALDVVGALLLAFSLPKPKFTIEDDGHLWMEQKISKIVILGVILVVVGMLTQIIGLLFPAIVVWYF